MPVRQTSFINNGIYHIMNRGVGGMNIFRRKVDWTVFNQVFRYYIKKGPQLPYSALYQMTTETRAEILKRHQEKPNLIEIMAYCLMPNHFHFLVKQIEEDGVSTCMRKASNSYSSKFNQRYKRRGHVFQDVFKAVQVHSDEQLLQTVRYIHLNPYVASLSSLENLELYQYSSFMNYLTNTARHFNLSTKEVLAFFQSTTDFKDFTLDQADYAKKYHDMKDVFLE